MFPLDAEEARQDETRADRFGERQACTDRMYHCECRRRCWQQNRECADVEFQELVNIQSSSQ